MDMVYPGGYEARDELRNRIRDSYGGYYPVGAQNKWHTGIHIRYGARPIRPIASGKVVACRITEQELNTEEIFVTLYGGSFPPIPREYAQSAADAVQTIVNKYYQYNQSTDKYIRTSHEAIPVSEADVLKAFLCNMSNNFVLIEHTLPYNRPPHSLNSTSPITYYSLYMHLKAYGTLSLLQQAQLPSWYKGKVSPDNSLIERYKYRKNNSIVIPANNAVGKDTIIGYAGDVQYQTGGVCHIEVFSPDARIVNGLVSYFDPAGIDPYTFGTYTVSGEIDCTETYETDKGSRGTREHRTLLPSDILTYFFYNHQNRTVGFKKDGRTDSAYWVPKDKIIPIGYAPLNPENGQGGGSENGFIRHYTPLHWHGFSFASDPGDDNSPFARNGKCDINKLIQIVEDALRTDEYTPNSHTDNYISTEEIIAAMKNDRVYDMLSRMIIHAESEWDGRVLAEKTRDYLTKLKYHYVAIDNYIEYFSALQFIDKVPQLRNIKKFYYFHPWEFVDMMRKITPTKQKIDGVSVTGRLSEEGITLLKRFENPYVFREPAQVGLSDDRGRDKLDGSIPYIQAIDSGVDGYVGLHRPGDFTVTYGFGEVVLDTKDKKQAPTPVRYPAIDRRLETKYPPMLFDEADERLRDVLEGRKSDKKTEGLVNNRLKNKIMAVTQNQFDALVMIEYNSSECATSLMDRIKTMSDQNSVENRSIIRSYIESLGVTTRYEGLAARRRAEAQVYVEVIYDARFAYP